jgi:hypothetical protein
MTMTEKVALSSTLTAAQLTEALVEVNAESARLVAECRDARLASDFGRLTRTMSAMATVSQQSISLLNELSRR